MKINNNELDLGQIVISKKHRTMDVFCGFRRGGIDDAKILLWSENDGARWIPEKQFNSRYSLLIHEDRKIEREQDKRVFKGLAMTDDEEQLERDRAEWTRHFTIDSINSERIQKKFRLAVKDATTKYEQGQIKIPSWWVGFMTLWEYLEQKYRDA